MAEIVIAYPHLTWKCCLGLLNLDSHVWVFGGINSDLLSMLIYHGQAQRTTVATPTHATECAAKDGSLDGRCVQVSFETEECSLDIVELTTVDSTDELRRTEEDAEIYDQQDNTENDVGFSYSEECNRQDQDKCHVLHAL